MIPEPRNRKREEYIKRCSKAVLAAMFLNGEISTDEYFTELDRQDEKT